MQIVVEPNGDMNFTRKPHLLDLVGTFGRKSIVRMTDIEFHETRQLFRIAFLTGPFAGRHLSTYDRLPRDILATDKSAFWYFLTEYAQRLQSSVDYCVFPRDQSVYFPTYEKAVEFEVEFVEFLRVLGYTMDA